MGVKPGEGRGGNFYENKPVNNVCQQGENCLYMNFFQQKSLYFLEYIEELNVSRYKYN